MKKGWRLLLPLGLVLGLVLATGSGRLQAHTGVGATADADPARSGSRGLRQRFRRRSGGGRLRRLGCRPRVRRVDVDRQRFFLVIVDPG